MRALRHLLLIVMGLTSVGAYGQQIQSQSQANLAGQLYASNFYGWTVPQGNSGQFSWSSRSVCTVSSGGVQFPAFTVGTPVLIIDQTTPAHNEIVTPTQVNINSGCQITINPAFQHTSFYFTSASFGLQEAINYSQKNRTSLVVVTPDWTMLGGVTAMITNAMGNTNVSVLDSRTSVVVPYLWDIPSQTYIAHPFGSGTLPASVPVLSTDPSGNIIVATYTGIASAFNASGSCVGFLNSNGTCSNSTATAAGVDTQLQANILGSFGVDEFLTINNTTHNLKTQKFLGSQYAAQYQTSAGSNNGVAQALGSTTGRLVFVTPDAGQIDNGGLYAASTPDNSTIYDLRPIGGIDANLNPIGPNIQFRNCTTLQPFYDEAQLATPYCGAYSSYFSNANTENNLEGGYPLMVTSFRDGPCINYGFDSNGLPWCITAGLAVNVAKWAPGIVDGHTINISTLGPGDINGISFGFTSAGGQGTVASDQGVTAFAVNGSQEALNTYSVIQSTTGKGDRLPIPAPFPGTQFYNRFAAGTTFWILDLESPVVGNTGAVSGAFVQNGQQGNGMADGTYTISCTGGGGTGATLQAVVVSGQVNPTTGLTVLNGGSGYTHAPTCASWSPAPGGTLAILKPMLDLEGTMTAKGTFVDNINVPTITIAGPNLTPITGSVITTTAVPASTTPGTQQSDFVDVNVMRSLPLHTGIAWVADPAFSQQINIVAVTTSGSTQHVGFQHLDPVQAGVSIVQGGTEGCFQEDANWALTNLIQCDYMYGAADAHTAIVVHQSHSGPSTNFPNGAARFTAPNNKIRIMSGAQPVSTTFAVPGFGGSQAGLPTLNWNQVSWVAGDDYVQPMNTGFDVSGFYAGNIISQAPSDNGDAGILLEFGGVHFDANMNASRIINLNDPSLYAINGGPLGEPGGYIAEGQFQSGLVLTRPPSNCVICVTDLGQKTVYLSGSAQLILDPPNQRWDMGNYGLIMNGTAQVNTLLFGGIPGLGLFQLQLSAGGGSFNPEYANLGTGSVPGDASGILGLEEIDAAVLRAGLTEPVIFFATGPSGGTTTYTYVATAVTALGGETLPGTPIVFTSGPPVTSPTAAYQLNGALPAGAQFLNVYRRTGFGGTGLICHVDAADLSHFGCIDQGQTGGAAEPTTDSSGVLIVATSGTIAGSPICTTANGACGGTSAVTQIIAGSGITVSPGSGLGAVTITASGTAGVTSINGTSGAFTFTGSGVSCTTTTCTFSSSSTPAFSAVTAGTNTAALLVGTGGTFGPTGTGIVNANEINGIKPSTLATGLLKNTTSTGVFTIAAAGTDYVTPTGNISGTAANLSGTPALPNGTTATTQTVGDNSTKLATTAFVLANAGSLPDCIDTAGTNFTCTVPVIAPGFTSNGTKNGRLLLTSTGTLPTAEGTNQIAIVVPNTVTHYTLELPAAAPTSGNTYLNCTVANPSVCSWGPGGSGGSSAFSSLTSGTNTAAAMLVGSGASLAATGTGTIEATIADAITTSGTSNQVWGMNSGGTAQGWQTITGGGTPAYPLTITGGVSGGLVYGSSGTVLTVSAAGTANTLVAWGGAGTQPFASHITDNTTNMTSSVTLIGPAGSATVCGICVSSNAFGLAGVSGNLMVIQSSVTRFGVTSTGIDLSSNVLGMGTSFTSNDAGVSRVSAGVVGIGTGAGGSIAGTLDVLNLNLGASGSLGTLTLGNATSGTVALVPVTGALGTVTASLPANTGIIAELNLAQTWGATQTFVAPVLGTPASVTLTNGTGLPTTGLTGTLQAAQEPAHTGDVTNTAGSLALTIAANAVTGSKMANNTVTATQLAAQYSKGSCTEVWGGSGTSFALTSGDDAISNNTCYNDSGVTRTITAVKCRSDIASNTTTVNPTFGSAGTGTTILSGALTCGSSLAYSSTGTVTNASWTTGAGINPVMGGTLTGTSISVILEYTF